MPREPDSQATFGCVHVCQCDPHLPAEDVHAATAVCAKACAQCVREHYWKNVGEGGAGGCVRVRALVATIREGPRGESPKRAVPDFLYIHP